MDSSESKGTKFLKKWSLNVCPVWHYNQYSVVMFAEISIRLVTKQHNTSRMVKEWPGSDLPAIMLSGWWRVSVRFIAPRPPHVWGHASGEERALNTRAPRLRQRKWEVGSGGACAEDQRRETSREREREKRHKKQDGFYFALMPVIICLEGGNADKSRHMM